MEPCNYVYCWKPKGESRFKCMHASDMMRRSPCCDKTKVTKGPWSFEEDELLKSFVTRFGNGGNWISLPPKAGLNRCGKSCRLRWLNYLRPNIKHGDFTEEEDFIIYSLYQSLGSRWSLIASKLRGRTDNDVKNYWNTRLKRKIQEGKLFRNVPSSRGITNNNNNNNHMRVQLEASCVNTDYYSAICSQINKVSVTNESDLQNINNNISKLNQYDELIPHTNKKGEREESRYSSQYSGSPSDSSVLSGQESSDFWMDLFSESFDHILVGSQLVEDKVREIASILDVLVD